MKIVSAFVLGAGLGTRLKSLTHALPKPLIPVVNRPLIAQAFDHLLGAGIERFVVNTHWRAEAYATAFPGRSYRGAPVEFRHEFPEILETGGGIKNVEDLLGRETFIVYNGDILTDLPLAPAIAAHAARGHEVTLILRSANEPRQIALDPASGRIRDIGGRLDPASPRDFLFTGIYLVEPSFFARLAPGVKRSVIPIFLEMIRTGARLGGVVIDGGHWWDLGSREQYLAVHAHLRSVGTEGDWIAKTAEIHPTATLSGATAIGSGATIGAGACLRDCLVWEGARIAAGSSLERCVVTANAEVGGRHTDADF